MRSMKCVPVYESRPFRLREHLDRLNRSLAGIRMPAPLSHGDWAQLCQESDFPQFRRATRICICRSPAAPSSAAIMPGPRV